MVGPSVFRCGSDIACRRLDTRGIAPATWIQPDTRHDQRSRCLRSNGSLGDDICARWSGRLPRNHRVWGCGRRRVAGEWFSLAVVWRRYWSPHLRNQLVAIRSRTPSQRRCHSQLLGRGRCSLLNRIRRRCFRDRSPRQLLWSCSALQRGSRSISTAANVDSQSARRRALKHCGRLRSSPLPDGFQHDGAARTCLRLLRTVTNLGGLTKPRPVAARIEARTR